MAERRASFQPARRLCLCTVSGIQCSLRTQQGKRHLFTLRRWPRYKGLHFLTAICDASYAGADASAGQGIDCRPRCIFPRRTYLLCMNLGLWCLCVLCSLLRTSRGVDRLVGFHPSLAAIANNRNVHIPTQWMTPMPFSALSSIPTHIRFTPLPFLRMVGLPAASPHTEKKICTSVPQIWAIM